MKYKRIFLVVLDSLGFGEAPDSIQFNDKDANTYGSLLKANLLSLENLNKLGFDKLSTRNNSNKLGYVTRLLELNKSKDTLSGHWEIMGAINTKPFVTYDEKGFPIELIEKLEKVFECKLIGNKSVSGTQIIEELGQQHIDNQELIIYTSEDSVLQLAADENTFGLDRLYECCEIARKITLDENYGIGRIIARPFIKNGDSKFERTGNRKDYAVDPCETTLLDKLIDNNLDVIGVGKIHDIFNGKGIGVSHKTHSNTEGSNTLLDMINKDFNGLCFVNLVDFDSKAGHRRNCKLYCELLNEFDIVVGKVLTSINDDDLLMICADHGNDPNFRGFNHTREMVPLVMYSKSMKGYGTLRYGNTFANIAKTIADNFDIALEVGDSYLDYLK